MKTTFYSESGQPVIVYKHTIGMSFKDICENLIPMSISELHENGGDKLIKKIVVESATKTQEFILD